MGSSSFYNCDSLTSITIPDSVISIGYDVFYDCDCLTSITIPDSVTSIGDAAFFSCDNLTDVTIGDCVTKIGEYAFAYCDSLTNIIIGDGVTKIDKDAFSDCKNLKSIIIPDSVTSIGVHAFYCCDSLTEINIGENNNYYCSIDGVLFNKKATKILQYPIGKTNTAYAIPDSVTSIGDDAFFSCDNLTSITIPDSVTSIGHHALCSCSNLKSIIMGYGVTSIGYNAFSNCNSLSIVWYRGSETEKSNITIDSDNSYLTNATWYYDRCVGTSTHTYDNACDVQCNACTYTRVPSDHVYDNACDTDCNECGEIRVPDHVCDNACDTVCNECGAILTVPDHVYDNACDATCNECGFIREVPDHVYSYNGYGICTICDHNYILDYLSYEISNGEVTITDCSLSMSSNAWLALIVVIPSTIKGYPVTCIGKNAFKNCTWLKDIVIPDGVTEICDYAFYECKRLNRIVIPVSLTNVGVFAFSQCINLSGVYYKGSSSQAPISIKNRLEYTDNLGYIYWYYNTCDEDEHAYSNLCDNACNYCKWTRWVYGHIYDNNCDTQCNICGEIRTITHKYDNACDTECNVCGEIRIVPDHVYDNACDTDCNECGATRTTTHSYESNVTNPDCTTQGYTTHTCSVCGDSYIDSYVDALGHSYDNVCDSICNECGVTRTVPDHVYDNNCDTACNICGAIREVPDHVYDNVCDADCNECGFVRDEIHTFSEENICTECGYNKILEYISYTITDNTVTITDCDTAISGKYVIPSTIDGCSVTSIGKKAFYKCSSLTGITISDGVTGIGYSAFKGCGSLESIIIPESVTWIGNEAFYQCSSLASITIPDGVRTIGDEAFYYCKSLTSITIPESVTSIGGYSFEGCSSLSDVYITDIAAWCNISYGAFYSNPLYYADNLYLNGELVTDVVIPDVVTRIPTYAFSCNSITSITIPNSVRSIGSYAFGGCISLENVYITDIAAWCEIYFDPYYYSEPLQYAENLYLNGELVTDVVIPDGVTTIPAYAFSCNSITSIIIPDSVTSIGYGAFGACDWLTDVWYSGSEEDKDNYIDIADNNEPLLSAIWHYDACSSGEHNYRYGDCTNGCWECQWSFDEHVYSYACDETCNECGTTRTVTHTYGDWITTKESTCGAQGSRYKECSICGDTVTESIDATGNHSYESVVTNPTCTAQGYTTHTCSVCGDSYKDTYVSKLGHSYDNACDAICNICGETRTITHSYKNVVTNPTCTAQGYTTHTCSVCGDSYKDTYVAKLGHSYDNACDPDCNVCGTTRTITHSYKNVVTNPTCTAQGYTTHTCSICGNSYKDTYVAKLGHSYDNACDTSCNVCGTTRTITHSYKNVVTNPTCTAQGYTTHTCSVCGANYKDSYVSKLGHSYDNACDANCKVCGTTRTPSSHVYDNIYDADCNVCGETREAAEYEWSINVTNTGVYALKPNKNYTGSFDVENIAVYDKNGKEVYYYEKLGGFPLVADQEYTVKFRYDCSDEISGTVIWNKTKKADKIFPDTYASEWYNNAIAYVVGRNIMSGYGSTGLFGTADNIQRQDFMVMLARLDGVDLSKYVNKTSPFSDVPNSSDCYYKAAVIWGYENGIVSGYANGKFGTGDKITREQLVKFLYNYANYKGLDTSYSASTKQTVKNKYKDYKNVSDWAQDAVLWAIENNVIKGKTDTTIVTYGNALRCEVAQIMYNIFLNDLF